MMDVAPHTANRHRIEGGIQNRAALLTGVTRHRGRVALSAAPVFVCQQLLNVSAIKPSGAVWTLNEIVRFANDRRPGD